MGVRVSTGLRNALLGSQGLQDILLNGVIRVFPGSQPASADDAEGTSHLLEITVSSGAFTPGSPANGLQLDEPVGGALAKLASQSWSGVGVLAGTAGWFRFYANDRTTGASTTAARIDGICGVNSGQLQMASTAIGLNATTTVDSFVVTMPAS